MKLNNEQFVMSLELLYWLYVLTQTKCKVLLAFFYVKEFIDFGQSS